MIVIILTTIITDPHYNQDVVDRQHQMIGLKTARHYLKEYRVYKHLNSATDSAVHAEETNESLRMSLFEILPGFLFSAGDVLRVSNRVVARMSGCSRCN
jgi:hypothetical protein